MKLTKFKQGEKVIRQGSAHARSFGASGTVRRYTTPFGNKEVVLVDLHPAWQAKLGVKHYHFWEKDLVLVEDPITPETYDID